MAFTFVESDLLPDISQKELDGIAKKLVEAGDPEPIATQITESINLVDSHTKLWDLDDDWKKRLVRPVCIWNLSKRLTNIPKKRQTAYDEAMVELRGIRDGKFSHLLKKEDPAPEGLPASTGAWGGKTKII